MPDTTAAPASTSSPSSPSSGPEIRDLPKLADADAKKAIGDAPVIPVLLLLTGGYLLWFGVHYWRDATTTLPSDPVKALLQGKPLPAPTRSATAAATLTAIETSTAASQASSGAAAEGGGGTLAPSGPGESAWIKAFLASIGAPNTQANQDSMSNWIRHETPWPPVARNNPLNTTQDMKGATDYNAVGVKNYLSSAEGLAATKITLENGNYNDVLMALRSGRGLCGRSWTGLHTWSGGGYSSVC